MSTMSRELSLWRGIVAGTMSLVIVGCSVASDEWLRARDSQNLSKEWTPLEDKSIHRVTGGMLSTALLKLRDRPFQALSTQECNSIAATPLHESAGSGCFLARAVRAVTDNGQFSVWINGDDVLVTYSALTKRDDVAKEPIILQLVSRPKELFVEVDLAE